MIEKAETIKLILPSEEYLDQVWAYRQECLDASSSTCPFPTVKRLALTRC